MLGTSPGVTLMRNSVHDQPAKIIKVRRGNLALLFSLSFKCAASAVSELHQYGGRQCMFQCPDAGPGSLDPCPSRPIRSVDKSPSSLHWNSPTARRHRRYYGGHPPTQLPFALVKQETRKHRNCPLAKMLPAQHLPRGLQRCGDQRLLPESPKKASVYLD